MADGDDADRFTGIEAPPLGLIVTCVSKPRGCCRSVGVVIRSSCDTGVSLTEAKYVMVIELVSVLVRVGFVVSSSVSLRFMGGVVIVLSLDRSNEEQAELMFSRTSVILADP